MHRYYDEINTFFITITFIRLPSPIFGEKLSIMLSNVKAILKICISTKNLFIKFHYSAELNKAYSLQY